MAMSTERLWQSINRTPTRLQAALLAVVGSVVVVLALVGLLHAVQHLAWDHASPAPVPAASITR